MVSTVVKKLGRWSRTVPSLWTKASAEFVACMIFHFVGSVSPTPLTNATSLLVLVYYTARMSGAHINPALSLTFGLLGYINPLELAIYWLAQVVGCVFGALWIALLVPGMAVGARPSDAAALASSGCFAADAAVTRAQLVGWEAVGTFAFILPIFSVVWYTQHKSGYGNTGPIIVGVSLYAAASAVAAFSGAALNPARAVASSIVFRCPSATDVGLYVAGEFIGAACVPLAVIPWYGLSSSFRGGGGGEEEDEQQQQQRPDANNSSDEDCENRGSNPDDTFQVVTYASGSVAGDSVVGSPATEGNNNKHSSKKLEKILMYFASNGIAADNTYACVSKPRASLDQRYGAMKQTSLRNS